ncbi:diguanylate cyclase (GGDEF)-like protein [Fluviicoccus keumensis]|uniref:diguanylate cyclase n=1 Tax=Fluviicoccus keumensis TaxID=1435465 RepID=A0A4Q7ZBL8_9GAMM|nr:diguanylate cyclase [Fluviicoccus keumensis]RZU48017.1 diguanylate cyclase (GGDEF)-like protein [Fluviicoccus keumensis]
MTTPSAAPDRAADLDYIRETLAARPLFCHFPRHLEKNFLETRVESSGFYIQTGQWPLLFMFSVIVAVAWIYFPALLSVQDYLQLKFIEIPLGVTILFIIFGHRIPVVRRHFHRVMFPVALFQLITIQLHILISAGNGYFLYSILNLLICMLLIALGLRFTFKVLLALYMTAGVAALALGAAIRLPLDMLAFGYYYGIFGAVVSALAGIAERQERFAFLQELLVNYQSEELTRLNRQLDRIAHQDALTGIPNRRSFDLAAEREWEIALREQQPLSLLLLDVDFFKRYNDTYGHEGGDHCLQAVARAIHDTLLRPADLAARYGGEEFVLLLPGADATGAAEVAERVLQAVDARRITHASSSVAPHVTVSIGVTTVTPTPGQPLQEALRQADTALYQAKEQGRHQYRVFRAPPPEEALEG